MPNESQEPLWRLVPLILLALVSYAISVLSLSGALSNIGWLEERVPLLTLLAVGTMCGYLALERRTKLNRLESLCQEGFDQLVGMITGTNVNVFRRREDFYRDAAVHIGKAKSTVDVTHINQSHSFSSREAKPYYDALNRIINGGRVKVRRVIAVKDMTTFNWMHSSLDTVKDRKLFIGCYKNEGIRSIPAFDMIIIDRDVAYLAGGTRAPGDEPMTVRVTHRHFVDATKDHFQALWNSSVKLNEYGLRREKLDDIKKNLVSEE